MVATRRSAQKEEDASQQGSGPSTSSQQQDKQGRGAAGRTRSRQTKMAAQSREEPRLEAIEEGSAGQAAEHAQEPQGARPDAAGEPNARAPPPQDDARGEPRGRPASVGRAAAAAASTAAARIAAAASDRSDSDSDDDDDILGPNLMDQLASSLRAALQARSGREAARDASPPPPAGQQPSKPDRKLGLRSDPDHIRWDADEGSKLKELVPAAQRVAPGTGADKEKGLARQVLAPPRVTSGAAADGPSTSRSWHQLPATKITDEVKQELRLLRLRGAYDPKRFYKSFDETKFPKHFQIGTVLDNPQGFYSSRLASRERGASLTQELLADTSLANARKKRYNKLQAEATKYQKVKKRKTDLKRTTAKPKRPKH